MRISLIFTVVSVALLGLHSVSAFSIHSPLTKYLEIGKLDQLLEITKSILHEVKKLTSERSACNRVTQNCAELLEIGCRHSGVYSIDPDGRGSFQVYCDQKTNGGGWTVIQKRKDGSENFYRGWNDYKHGFGDLKGEFWLGLDKINRLTHQTHNRLRVELEDFNGNSAYANYSFFAVASEQQKYKLTLGKYKGNAGDSFTYHNGAAFTTKDRDNDKWSSNCAVSYHGAWWYKKCHHSNLNGKYLKGKHNSYANGVNWNTWKGYKYSVKRAEMKIRPV